MAGFTVNADGRIEKFVRQAILVSKASAIELRIVVGSREDTAQTFPLPKRNADISALASDIDEAIVNERGALDVPVMTARLIAYNVEGAAVGSMRVRVKDAERAEKRDVDDRTERGGELDTLTEHGTARALIAQQMRHNESLVRSLTTAMASQSEGYRTAIEFLSQRLALSEERVMRMREESEQFIEAHHGSLVKSQALDLVSKYAPVLVNEIAMRTGKLPAGAMPPQLIETLASLDQEQIMKIAATLRPDQLQVFGQAVRSAAASQGQQPTQGASVTRLPSGKTKGE